MRRTFFKLATALGVAGLAGQAAAQSESIRRATTAKVVYQFSEGNVQAMRAIGNLRNHLVGAPGTHIVVVALGDGADFLVEGARDPRGRLFDAPVAALASLGVEFRVCRNTLVARNIPENKLLLEARVVPAGVVEIARLQIEEGYAYIKP